MKLDAIIFGVLYNHFDGMKKKGRNVIPWFQTAFVVALYLVIIITLFYLAGICVFVGKNTELSISETKFILIFISLIGVLFFIIKKYYFNSGKYLKFHQEFNNLTHKKQRLLKIVVLSFICITPFATLYLLYLVRG